MHTSLQATSADARELGELCVQQWSRSVLAITGITSATAFGLTQLDANE
jgi:hypothetical protein